MQWSDLPLNPAPRMLRQFAGLWTGFFSIAACWQAWGRERPTVGLVLGALAVTVGPLGLLWPALMRPIFVAWMVVVFPIGWLVSRIVLALVFYGVMTPLAMVFRLMGRDSLTLRPQPATASYWQPKPTAEARRYFRQF